MPPIEDMLGEEEGQNGFGNRTYYATFQPNGASAPTNVRGYGIASITRTATGTYKVLFNDQNFACLQSASAMIYSDSGGPAQGFTINYDPALSDLTGAGVGASFVFVAVNGSGNRADVAAGTNTYINVNIVVSKNYKDVAAPVQQGVCAASLP